MTDDPDSLPIGHLSPGTYVSRPVTVQAMRLSGTPANIVAIESWLGRAARGHSFKSKPHRVELSFAVAKNDNQCATIAIGDWVIAERDGDGFYPCVGAQFVEKYTPGSFDEVFIDEQEGPIARVPYDGHVRNLDHYHAFAGPGGWLANEPAVKAGPAGTVVQWDRSVDPREAVLGFRNIPNPTQGQRITLSFTGAI